MARVKLTQRREETVEVDVDFPVYRHDYYLGDRGDSSEYWTKTYESGRSVKVKVTDDGRGEEEWSVPVDTRSMLSGSRDYALGEGEYACAPEEFEEALVKARAFVEAAQ